MQWWHSFVGWHFLFTVSEVFEDCFRRKNICKQTNYFLNASEEKPIFIFFHILNFDRTINHCYWQLDWTLIYSRNIYSNILAEGESGWGWTRDVSSSAATLVPLCYKQPRCTITLCLIKSNKASNFDVHT